MAVSTLKKMFESPSVRAPKIARKSNCEWFLQSLADKYDHLRHPEAEQFVRKGVKHVATRDQLVARLFSIYRVEIFEEKVGVFKCVIHSSLRT